MYAMYIKCFKSVGCGWTILAYNFTPTNRSRQLLNVGALEVVRNKNDKHCIEHARTKRQSKFVVLIITFRTLFLTRYALSK